MAVATMPSTRCAEVLPDSSITNGVRCALPANHAGTHAKPPYPWCWGDAMACTDKGRCLNGGRMRGNCGD